MPRESLSKDILIRRIRKIDWKFRYSIDPCLISVQDLELELEEVDRYFEFQLSFCTFGEQEIETKKESGEISFTYLAPGIINNIKQWLWGRNIKISKPEFITETKTYTTNVSNTIVKGYKFPQPTAIPRGKPYIDVWEYNNNRPFRQTRED